MRGHQHLEQASLGMYIFLLKREDYGLATLFSSIFLVVILWTLHPTKLFVPPPQKNTGKVLYLLPPGSLVMNV